MVRVVQMHGEPGSGKSTVARALAARIDAVVLDKDVIKSALLRTGIAEQPAASGAYEVHFDLARHLIDQGRSVILDNPVYWASVEENWLTIAALAGSRPVLIECICANRDELLRRLATREVRESQPREPFTWAARSGLAPTAHQPRLTLDTTRPLDEIVAEAAAYVRSEAVK